MFQVYPIEVIFIMVGPKIAILFNMITVVYFNKKLYVLVGMDI